jgi:hypothetical protein
VLLCCNALRTQRSCFSNQGDIPSIRKIQYFKLIVYRKRPGRLSVLRGTKKGAGMRKLRLCVEFWWGNLANKRQERKVAEGQAIKAQRARRGFFNLSDSCGWMVNAKPRPLYPSKWSGAHCIGDQMDSRAGLDGCWKCNPLRCSNPGPSSS